MTEIDDVKGKAKREAVLPISNGMRLLILTQAVDSADPVLGFFTNWIAEFAKKFETVHVICLTEGRHSLPENVFVHSLGKEAGAPRIVRTGRFLRLIWMIRAKYDSVFVHMNPEYIVLGGILWRMWGKRIALWYTHKSVTMRLRIAVLLSHVVFTASRESFRLQSAKVRVVGHGIPEGMFQPHGARNGAARVCTVGRISQSKRVREMIEAVRIVRSRGSKIIFTIVGAPATDVEREYERALRAEFSDDSSIQFRGAVPFAELPDFLCSQDLFLHLSTTGSLDKAVLDALACGVSVMSSSEAYRPMLEPHGLTTEASPEALAKAIEKFMALSDKAAISEILREEVRKNHSLSRLILAIRASL